MGRSYGGAQRVAFAIGRAKPPYEDPELGSAINDRKWNRIESSDAWTTHGLQRHAGRCSGRRADRAAGLPAALRFGPMSHWRSFRQASCATGYGSWPCCGWAARAWLTPSGAVDCTAM